MAHDDPTGSERYEAELARVTVGEVRPLAEPIRVVDHDPAWPGLYEREARRIRGALGGAVERLEHVGSTSVPGLPAKPVIDIALEVADASDEDAYVPELEAAGYVLRIREPEWYEHRLLKGTGTSVNLHVFGRGCEEVDRMVRFRDRLRGNRVDRELYAATKRELAAQDWTYMQQYADAKTTVVLEILARADASVSSPMEGGIP